MDISYNIKRRRLELGLSQQELANALGYRSRSTIAKIESGENDVPLSKLMNLSRTLDISIEALLTGSREPSKHAEDEHFVPRALGTGRTAVVVLAGGKSTRNKQNIPNQFINVLGKPVIIYGMETYQHHPLIDDIYVVCLSGWEGILNAYARQYGITKLRGIILAGESGVLSAWNGVKRLMEEGFTGRDFVVFQESTRPFVTQEMISKLMCECRTTGSAIIGHSMDDYVQFCVDSGQTSSLDRNKIVDLQSPDAYSVDMLTEVFDRAQRQNIPLTENCIGMLMAQLGYRLNFCEGSTENMKILRQEDLAVFTALLKRQD